MTTLITSLNQKLFDQYGRNMIEGFINFSHDVKMIIVFEGDIPLRNIPKNDLISLIKLESSDHEYFHKVFGKLYEAHGLKIIQEQLPNGQLQFKPIQDYRFNLVRFSFKIFSLQIAREKIASNERFAWIDADLKCLMEFRQSDLDPFFPQGEEIMSYLGRIKHPPRSPYSECGFLGFNPESPQLDAFLERMKALYMTGEAFRFDEWHDSWLWDEVRKEFEFKGHKFRNISGKYDITEHPFINCGLGAFFDHLKGPERKKTGKSFASDYQNKTA
jgi:hypothetical protein